MKIAIAHRGASAYAPEHTLAAYRLAVTQGADYTADGPRWLTTGGLQQIAAFATGIGPSKLLLDGRPDVVEHAHVAGPDVTPYTFTTGGGPATRFGDVTAEMRHYLWELGVDALFTETLDLLFAVGHFETAVKTAAAHGGTLAFWRDVPCNGRFGLLNDAGKAVFCIMDPNQVPATP